MTRPYLSYGVHKNTIWYSKFDDLGDIIVKRKFSNFKGKSKKHKKGGHGEKKYQKRYLVHLGMYNKVEILKSTVLSWITLHLILIIIKIKLNNFKAKWIIWRVNCSRL